MTVRFTLRWQSNPLSLQRLCTSAGRLLPLRGRVCRSLSLEAFSQAADAAYRREVLAMSGRTREE